jgi:hypothetical protein
MPGLRFTIRQMAVGVAVIGVLLAILIQNQAAFVLVVIPAALGFGVAALTRPSAAKASRFPMTSPPILLILILAGIGAISLAITVYSPDTGPSGFVAFALIGLFSIPILLGVLVYHVSRRSLRFRLTVEILTLLALLALSAWTWQPRNLLQAAMRADGLAAQLAMWAEAPHAPEQRDALRREAEWFRRRAFLLRCQALWYGLTNGSHGHDDFSMYDTEHLVHELGALEAMDAHEMRARQAHEGQKTLHEPSR